MPGILVVGEVAGGSLTKLSTEIATVARALAEAGGGEVRGIVVAEDPTAAATELATFTGGPVTAVTAPDLANVVAPQRIATELAANTADASWILVGGTPDGRDVAGILSALTGWPVLTNATAVTLADGRPVVEMSVFGGKLVTHSTFTGEHGIVTVRPNAVDASPAASTGSVEPAPASGEDRVPAVKVVERVAEAGAEASLEEARVVVAGGRGVAGPDGFRIVEELAKELGGVVGATRAAVDSGWIPYARQIGQTGKIVKPALYLALGVSGAIQHKVGMQTAESIVAVNRDPDAPIADFADVIVIGDLFEVGQALLDELRARAG